MLQLLLDWTLTCQAGSSNSFFSRSRCFLPGLLSLLFWGLGAAAQPTTAPTPSPASLPASLLPVSPTAASFQRVDKQGHVNLLTGAAQTSVPLAELRSGPLQTAVTLSYTWGGLKVVQPQDLLGLGWALQAGGEISRHVVGRLDEDQSQYGLYNSDSIRASHSLRLKDNTFRKSMLQGFADAAPDVYDFSVEALHGRFIIDDTTVVLLPQQPVQIRRLPTGFQVTAETGVRYLFEATETTVPHHDNFGAINLHPSSWHLTQIIAAGNTDTITFHYSDWDYREKPHLAQTTLQVLNRRNGMPVSYTEQPAHNTMAYGSTIHVKLLDSITTRGARILLHRDTLRVLTQVSSWSTLPGRPRHLVRTLSLGHSYFTGLPNISERRLRLDWVQEAAGLQRLPAYQFVYDTTFALPPTTSTGQDHWGYYNGANGNGGDGSVASALLPHPALGTLSANRNPSFDYAQAGALQRITYPTGGTTTLTYEPNRYAISHRMSTVLTTTNLTAFLASSSYLDVGKLRAATSYAGFGTLPGASFAFTLTEQTTVSFIAQVQPLLAANYSNKRPDFFLLKQGGPQSGGDSIILAKKGQLVSPDTVYQGLLPGRYVAWIVCEDSTKYGDTFAEDGNSLLVRLPREVYTPDVAGSGVRVKKTVSVTAGAPPLTRTYTYVVETPQGPCSSGTMLLPVTADGAPIYRSTYFESEIIQYSGPKEPGLQIISSYSNFTSDITAVGDEYNKYNFYYACVTEQEVGVGVTAGETRHYYGHQPDQFNDVLPVKVETYRAAAGAPPGFQLVQHERYHYKTETTQAPLFEAAFPYTEVIRSSDIATDRLEIVNAYYKSVYAYALELDSTVTTRYDDLGRAFTTTTQTAYRQWRPVRSVLHDSHGQQRSSSVTYLSDYAPSLSGYAQLRQHNFNPVVEVQHWMQPTGRTDSLLIGGELTRYDPQWQRPASTWHLDATTPLVALDAQQLVSGVFTTWLRDTHYRQVGTEYYHPVTGDPIGQQVMHGSTTAYVWGYQRTALIAQVQHASPAQVAYTGFEAGELGRWQGTTTAISAPGYTGRSGYDLMAAPLTCRGLPPGQYRLSCRQRGSSSPPLSAGQQLLATGPALQGWTAYAATVTVGATGTAQLAGSGHVDDVQLYPVGAQLTSYTHEPLVGETSQTDPTGRTTYYEYDDLGRLVRTRDEQGRILSQQQYHYAGQ